MSAPKTTPTAAAPVPTVASDVPCSGCGYNLRGLSASGLCPECAHPVERSLEAHRKLAGAPSLVWARMVFVGLIGWLVLSACSLGLVLFINAGAGSTTIPVVLWINFPGPKMWCTPVMKYLNTLPTADVFTLTAALSPVLLLLASYLLTWPRQQGAREPVYSLRRLARLLPLALYGGFWGAGLATMPLNNSGLRTGFALLAVATVELPCTVLLYLYLSDLSRRLELIEEAVVLRVCGLVIGVMIFASALLMLGLSPRELTREMPFRFVFWLYGAVAASTAVVATATLIRLAMALRPMIRGTTRRAEG